MPCFFVTMTLSFRFSALDPPCQTLASFRYRQVQHRTACLRRRAVAPRSWRLGLTLPNFNDPTQPDRDAERQFHGTKKRPPARVRTEGHQGCAIGALARFIKSSDRGFVPVAGGSILGVEEQNPDAAKDQRGKAKSDYRQHKIARVGFGLVGFGGRLYDEVVLFFWHKTALRTQVALSVHVPSD
jgi:hypothetical protein